MKPRISVIVPVYNEVGLIRNKIEDLRKQNMGYMGNMELIFVDGGSTDGTVEILEDSDIYVEHSLSGKTRQINAGLDVARGDIIIITDVDARMSWDCINKLVEEIRWGDVAVVGAWSIPDKAKFLDPFIWWISNILRHLQGQWITCPWVIGTCYAFDRKLLKQFPEDVVADDVYIALKANFEGYRTLYTRKAKVWEVRNPKSWGQFFWHKRRKANALLREFTRFSYRMAYARPAWKMLFIFWFLFLVAVAGWDYPFFKQTSELRRLT